MRRWIARLARLILDQDDPVIITSITFIGYVCLDYLVRIITFIILVAEVRSHVDVVSNDTISALDIILLFLFIPFILFVLIMVPVHFIRMFSLKNTTFHICIFYIDVVVVFAIVYHLSLNFLPGAFAGAIPAIELWKLYDIANTDSSLSHLSNYVSQNRLDSLYYSVITQTTVGYGEIHPTHTVTKVSAIVQSLIGVFIVAVGIGKIAQSGRRSD